MNTTLLRVGGVMRAVRKSAVLLVGFCCIGMFNLNEVRAQDPSIAQQWNEALLFSITNDFARPPIHARNLYHTSMAMYDAWAAYDPAAEPLLLGRTLGSYTSPFSGVVIPDTPEEVEAARREAISFACYRIILHRFQNAPGAFTIFNNANALMDNLGYNRFNTSTNYVSGGPAELGNYIAQQIINFGFTDGSNESANFANQYYEPLNGNILPEEPGPGDVIDPNRWQAISLTVSIDQSGNVISDPPHLAPEWGDVLPFSMNEDQMVTLERDGQQWNVYYDPGHPPYLDTTVQSGLESLYKWNHLMVTVWQSHLDPNDETLWDVSPATIGNVPDLPQTFEEHLDFYDFFNGGTPAAELGYDVNPVTGQPYEPQIVKRADYARILAEFWADGLDSETPPGHWFKIYNEIRHHPLWENKWMGEGEELDQLHYDLLAYVTIGGAMHDAAIAAWSVKGYYDYVRPISAIRYMCAMGQSSDPMLPNYHPAGAPIIPGYIELVEVGDPLAGADNEHVGKIKLYSWRGPEYIGDPETTYAGVGWILGENWWPYQRPTFVTPPFAGYVSGHSTYSRTAAEVMSLITGNSYFPGGMSNFVAEQNEFLHFEEGPSETVILQWATYRDASDQCSLSRIWGGIHPPADDIPGRLIGQQLGPHVVEYANQKLFVERPIVASVEVSDAVVNIDDIGSSFTATITFDQQMDVSIVPAITFLNQDPLLTGSLSVDEVGWISSTQYQITYIVEDSELEQFDVFMRIGAARNIDGVSQNVHLEGRPFVIDTRRPELDLTVSETDMVNDAIASNGSFAVELQFSEACDAGVQPTIELQSAGDLSSAIVFDPAASNWTSGDTFVAFFSVTDTGIEESEVNLSVSSVSDASGNAMMSVNIDAVFAVDTRNPIAAAPLASTDLLNTGTLGSNALEVSFTFDEPMNTENGTVAFPENYPIGDALVFNGFASGWEDSQTFVASYNQQNSDIEFFDVDMELIGFTDLAGNAPEQILFADQFSIDTQRPEVVDVNPTGNVVADADVEGGSYSVDISFQESMSQGQLLLVQLNGAGTSLTYDPIASEWISEDTFRAAFDAIDENVEIAEVGVSISFGADLAGNNQIGFTNEAWVSIDTRNPQVLSLFANTYQINAGDIGNDGSFSVLLLFDEPMITDALPALSFLSDEAVDNVLTLNTDLSSWLNPFSFQAFFDVADEADFVAENVGIGIANVADLAGNPLNESVFEDVFDIDLLTIGVDESIASTGFRVYPNPVAQGNQLLIGVGEDLSNAQLDIFSIDGRLIETLPFGTMPKGVYTVATGNWAPGHYVISMRADGTLANERLIVTR